MINFIKNTFSKILNTERMIYVNHTSYNGKSVVVKNGKIWIDGQEVTSNEKQISIRVEGNVEKLDIDYCDKIDVTGSVGELSATSGNITCGNVTKGINTTSGDIKCGDVNGNISSTSGDVECKNVTGSVETLSGDVDCENISGKVSTMSGDIKYKK